FGGGGAVDFELHAFAPLAKAKVLDVPPHQGSFDLPDARLIAPGAPARSVVYYRMAKFGRGHMPRLGADLPDEAGLALVHDWIKRLPPDGKSEIRSTKSETNPNTEVRTPFLSGIPPSDIDRRLAAPATALELARAVGRRQLPPAERDAVLARAAKLPAGGVRD